MAPTWYVSPTYDGPRTFPAMPEYSLYIGHYRADSVWGGDLRVYLLKGKLIAPVRRSPRLALICSASAEEEWTPETAEFAHIFEGKARLLEVRRHRLWRIDVD